MICTPELRGIALTKRQYGTRRLRGEGNKRGYNRLTLNLLNYYINIAKQYGI
jgi:hypothetical protein